MSQDHAEVVGAIAGAAGDTLGSDEPAVDWGGDIEESDKAVAEVKSAANKAGFRLKRHDMGDSADSRFACVLALFLWLQNINGCRF